MPPKLTGSQRAEIVRRYRGGESANSLAPQFGVHVSTILTHLRRAGLDPTWAGVIDQLDVSAAERLYGSGLSLAKVGGQLGVSAGTVRNAFLRAGVPIRPIGTNQSTR
jgi:DNA-binding CsgD family transcriptional regulator